MGDVPAINLVERRIEIALLSPEINRPNGVLTVGHAQPAAAYGDQGKFVGCVLIKQETDSEL